MSDDATVVVCCWLLDGVCCVLFGICGVSRVIRSLLFVACWLLVIVLGFCCLLRVWVLFVVCCWMFAVFCVLLCVVCGLCLCDVRCLLSIVSCLLFSICCVLSVGCWWVLLVVC